MSYERMKKREAALEAEAKAAAQEERRLQA